jgi:Protein of unknown function (DUF4197)
MRLSPIVLGCSLAVAMFAIADASADSLSDRLKQALKKPAAGQSSLGQEDAASGLKEALAQGVKRAIGQVGRRDGFQGDPLVRILVPEKMRAVTDTARRLGAGRKVDEFELSMNRAAEQAVPVAADIFANAVRQMTVRDAVDIVRGSDDAGTRYFRRVTEDSLRAQFQPIVAKATDQAGVTQRYKGLVGKNAGVATLLGGGQALDLDAYVTTKAMDGLFFYVARQEKEIRHNPGQRTTALLRRVFGG